MPTDAAAKAQMEPLVVRAASPAQRRGLASREWLLTDGAGGYAMGSVAGAPARRYHGLLCVALSPPVNRAMLLSSMAEIVWLHPDTPGCRSVDLTDAAFSGGTLLSGGRDRLVSFELGEDAVWTYDLGEGARLTRRLHLHERRSAATVRYELTGAAGWVRCRPLLAMRDHHHLNGDPDASVRVAWTACGRSVTVERGHLQMTLESDAAFKAAPSWWRNFWYATETERGYDDTEHLFCPGELHLGLSEPAQVLVRLGGHAEDTDLRAWRPADAGAVRQRVDRASSVLLRGGSGDEADDRAVLALALAADRFVVRRGPTPRSVRDEHAEVSILAGYPWFSDWGRDAMIAMPGLLLATGRVGEAASVLRTFARAQRDGLIPNRFSDEGGQAEYNTVDASLWFIRAVCDLAGMAGDPQTRAIVFDELVPACHAVVAAYVRGTRYDIRVDQADGLVAAGNESTQLTWMDAKRDGFVFTPRDGKPVEIQALWQSAVRSLAVLVATKDVRRSRELTALADRAAESIRGRFWCERFGCAYDRLQLAAGGWRPVMELRPNQLLLVSLPHGPLNRNQERSLARVCRERLWTPMGVRTLDSLDAKYRGRFTGPIRELDAAYHNGTVWPWLMGPMVEAWLRAFEFTPEACVEARMMIQKLVDLVTDPDAPALGQLSEVYDGDTAPKPQSPGGCPAQAWSVAEVLRALLLIRGCESAKA